jgi:hypothetical protein
LELIQFLRRRFNERFFRPIRVLRTASGNEQGYGFAVMALCSLLVETIQCYRLGLPSTHPRELSDLRSYDPPAEYDVPRNERKNGSEVFKAFFVAEAKRFPNVDGSWFYQGLRNGLLHQAQTKDGWQINTRRLELCDPKKKIIDRDRFAMALEDAFKGYLATLEQHRVGGRYLAAGGPQDLVVDSAESLKRTDGQTAR